MTEYVTQEWLKMNVVFAEDLVFRKNTVTVKDGLLIVMEFVHLMKTTSMYVMFVMGQELLNHFVIVMET